ncbi:hypothetical protein ACTXJ9_11155 [Brachybacterium tyrofermentans]|uniref:hypothetical protein n=1 Tax=Brachybacterium tyrofermentans TaxID=47848 RepID=UPI003FCF159A
MSLHGVTIGEPGHDLVVTAFDPSFGDVRTGDVEWPLRHGSRPGVDFLEAGTISMTLRSGYGVRTRAEADRVTSGFMRAWRRDLSVAPGVLTPLLVQTGDTARLVYGRAGRISPPVPDSVLMRQGLVEIVCEFRVMDPVVYDVSPTGLTISVVPRSLGGIIAPIVTPVTTTLRSGVEYRMLDVPGDAPAPLTVTFHGPATDPQVKIGGTVVGISGSIAYDEDIVVDGQTRTVQLATGAPAGHRLSRVSRLDQLAAPPGVHEIAFTATDRTGTARVTVEATPAYYHL